MKYPFLKILVVSSIVMSFAGCETQLNKDPAADLSANPDDPTDPVDPVDPGEPPVDPGPPVVIRPTAFKIKAIKTYRPALSQPGEQVLDDYYGLEIPAAVPVTVGSAGTQKLSIEFDDVICTYQGSKKRQDKKGAILSYDFKSCADSFGNKIAAASGDLLEVKKFIRVTVDNGDPSSPTVVEATIKVLK